MAKPILMSSQGTVTIKVQAIHTPNNQGTPTLHNPLLHPKPTEGDSNRAATKIDMVRLRQRMQVVQARLAAATVSTMLGQSWDDN